MSKQANRRERRRRTRRDERQGLTCCCAACQRRNVRWPSNYVGNGCGAVYAASSYPTAADGRRYPRGDFGRLVAGVSFECYQNENAPPERSPSAEAIRWLEDQRYSGVDVELHEAELRSEDVESDVHRLESLRRHLIGLGLGDADRLSRERRYLEIVELWPERRQWKRLGQWLRAEFPGWTMNGEGR